MNKEEKKYYAQWYSDMREEEQAMRDMENSALPYIFMFIAGIFIGFFLGLVIGFNL